MKHHLLAGAVQGDGLVLGVEDEADGTADEDVARGTQDLMVA
jgi:hypothetical protein